MSNITGDVASFSSGNTGEDEVQQLPQQPLHNQFPGLNTGLSTDINSNGSTTKPPQLQPPVKKKRNLPGTPDPTAEVIALSPTTLMATNRFVCEICNKGFQRDQNLQLHRRGHNLPWKLRQRASTEIRKRVYICPEPSCVHHNPARALGDLTGIKKHFCRKHGEKKWKCDKCSKKYAVLSDWKAHLKTCGTKEYKCDCGTIFSRRDSFVTHRAFCDALTEENNKKKQGLTANMEGNLQAQVSGLITSMPISNNSTSIGLIGISGFNNSDAKNPLESLPHDLMPVPFKPFNMATGMCSSTSDALFSGLRSMSSSSSSLQLSPNSSSIYDGLPDYKNGRRQLAGSAHMSATALLQKAAQMGATASSNINSPMMQKSFVTDMAGTDQLCGAIKSSPYVGMQQQQHNSSYEHIQLQQTNQSQLIGMEGGAIFPNQFLQKPKEMSPQFFEIGTAGMRSAMNDMGMLSGIFMGSDQHDGLTKNMEHEQNTNLSQGRSRMTVDFLGIGGSRPANLHEQQYQQQQGLEFEALNQQRLQGLHPFRRQLSHGQAAMEKAMWEV